MLEPDSQLGSTVTLVVGTDYSGAHPVTVTVAKPPATGGTATPTASPKPPAVTAAEDICGI